ncbi:MAG: DUF4331 domain-containing protein [Candidatus Saccharibacteria bacterium]|nr:DUF4331 domain-containing protein [Moraxellaceae bacterium]
MKRQLTCLTVAVLMATGSFTAMASSHREAPSITKTPKVDGTDFYMFNSYESGRAGYVTLIANYLPLQDSYGGPNYFSLDPNALYEIEVDNNGDAKEDITFQFRFQQSLKDLQVPVNGTMVSVPLSNIGAITNDSSSAQNTAETFSVTMVKGNRRMGQRTVLGSSFKKPFDNVGNKSIPNYAAYANSFIQPITFPGCGTGKVFVGQRKDSFAINVGQIFDLVNIAAPISSSTNNTESAGKNTLADKNVTTIALEVPVSCLANAGEPIIGGWTTASLRQGALRNPVPASDIKTATKEGGAWTQVSRLGMPLVNEVVIGLKDKDKFNASQPMNDGQFATYVTNPTLPTLLQILFGGAGVKAPTNYPRTDLVAAFLTGIPTLNKPANVVASEQLRLNTSIPAAAQPQQKRLGVIGGDNAGFPNGRRPGDDVVDIALRVVMGKVCTIAGVNTAVGCKASDAPSGTTDFTDGALQTSSQFDTKFPYLTTPIPGSP